MINETAEAIIQTTRAEIYNPVVITVWVSVLVIFFLVTWITGLSKKVKWNNFWAIWFWTAVASGIAVTIFVMSPTTVSVIINWFKGLFRL